MQSRFGGDGFAILKSAGKFYKMKNYRRINSFINFV